MKQITIKSYFSEMDWRDGDNLDGYYRVNVPKKHTDDCLEVISWSAHFLDDIRFDGIAEKEDVEDWFDNHEIKCLPKSFFIKNLDLALGWADEGSNLNSTLCFLKDSKGENGWSFTEGFCRRYDYDYDADYCQFR